MTLDKDSDKHVTPEELKMLSDEVCIMNWQHNIYCYISDVTRGHSVECRLAPCHIVIGTVSLLLVKSKCAHSKPNCNAPKFNTLSSVLSITEIL